MKTLKTIGIVVMTMMLLSTPIFAVGGNKAIEKQNNNKQTQIEKTTYEDKNNAARENRDVLFQDKGGWGKFGYGKYHAWATYNHPTRTHRVVLTVDNRVHYGAYELAGPQNYSYTEARTGKYVLAYGELE